MMNHMTRWSFTKKDKFYLLSGPDKNSLIKVLRIEKQIWATNKGFGMLDPRAI